MKNEKTHKLSTKLFYTKTVVPTVTTPTKVVGSGVKILFWWGAGERQAPAQAAVVHNNVQKHAWRRHLHHRV